MKVKTIQIIWHEKLAIFSVDFHPTEHRFITSGSDNMINEWTIKSDQIQFNCSLTRHTSNVNCVRYSSDGRIASGGDDGLVLVWAFKDEYKVQKVLRVNSDIYDLAWQNEMIVTASVDGCIKLFNVENQTLIKSVNCHSHYVQGVAIHSNLIASLSSDRSLQIHRLKSEKVEHIVKEYKIDGQRIFENEEMNSFFRRPCWSPDGSLLLVPTGKKEDLHQVYGYNREYLKSGPLFILDGFKKSTICCKFCPLYFKSNKAPFKFIFGVASLDEIVFYDTEQVLPLGLVGKIHYAGITDFAWSKDGRYIMISSNDGFCSMIQFDPNELGQSLKPAEIEDLHISKSTVSEGTLIQPMKHDEIETIPTNLVKSTLDGSTFDLNKVNTLNSSFIKRKILPEPDNISPEEGEKTPMDVDVVEVPQQINVLDTNLIKKKT